MPPKVRMFLWRACSNILPTRENLNRRRVQVDPMCGMCCQKPESVGHLLWECPLARNVWALCSGRIQKCPNTEGDFFMLLQRMVSKLEEHDVEKWAVIAWAIWNARNKYYFERIQLHPRDILRGATGFLQEYQRFMQAQQQNEEAESQQ